MWIGNINFWDFVYLYFYSFDSMSELLNQNEICLDRTNLDSGCIQERFSPTAHLALAILHIRPNPKQCLDSNP
jgi:hypothetical protein